MDGSRLLHHQRAHRARQLRWVLPGMAALLLGALATLLVTYLLSDRAVGTEFFRAHKTIGHTGELLQRGLLAGAAVLMLLVIAIAVLAFRLTHRIVRPVHAVHRTLDALVAGDLGVRIELRREDEFQEIGDTLNRLVDAFATTLGHVHTLVDRIDAMAADAAREANARPAAEHLHRLAQELDRTMEFFRLEPRRVIREDGA